MAGMGTGVPLNFECPKCRRGAYFRTHHLRLSRRGQRWRLTGRRRKLTKKQQGTGAPRTIQFRVEYECLDCGHVGWSRHGGCLTHAVNRRDCPDCKGSGHAGGERGGPWCRACDGEGAVVPT